MNKDRYRTKEGIDKWRETCEFSSWPEAAEALGISLRAVHRWRSGKFPPGLYGEWIIERMIEIQEARTGK